MRKFVITTGESWRVDCTYHVEANSEEEAITKIKRHEVGFCDKEIEGTEHIEIAEVDEVMTFPPTQGEIDAQLDRMTGGDDIIGGDKTFKGGDDADIHSQGA